MNPPPATSRPGSGRPSALIITNIVPVESRSAGEQRLLRLSSLLAGDADVVIVARSPDSGQDRTRGSRPPAPGLHVLPVAGRLPLHAVLGLMQFDVVIFEYWHVARDLMDVVRRRQPGARIVIDAVDLHFLRESRQAEVEGDRPPDPSARLAEIATYMQADAVIMVSEAEAAVYRDVAPAGPPVVVVPIIVDPVAPQRLGTRGVFVGNFWHRPNVDGIQWFCREVWPAVTARVPGAQLEIFGANTWDGVAELGAVGGVTVRGYVPDTAEVYRDARVALAPLRFGAGMKGKVCEAMARGVPVVSSTIGAEGLDLLAGEHAAISDDPTGFAEAVARLLADEAVAQQLGEAGRRRILQLCGPDRVRREVAALLPPQRSGGWRRATSVAARAAVRGAELVWARSAGRS